MVTDKPVASEDVRAIGHTSSDARIWEAVGEVLDPEVPVLTIADLGVLRGVRHEGDEVVVTITPTYSGCPAMDLIRHEVELTLQALHVDGRVETVLSPAWTTEWMSEAGKAKLTEYGIAPPTGRRAVGGPVPSLVHHPVPALRVAGHHRAQPLRLDLLQVPLAL